VALHRADLQHQPGPVNQLNQCLGLGDARGQRLLHRHVLAGLQRLGCDRVVEPVRCGDDDRLDRLVGEHLPQVGVGRRQVVALGHRAGHLLARVADRDQLNAVRLLQRRQVGDLGDTAAADQRESDRTTHGRLLVDEGKAHHPANQPIERRTDMVLGA
jgi:hypothetical protein